MNANSGAADGDWLEQQLEAFERAWQADADPPPIDAWLSAADESQRPMLARELVMIDLEHRWRRDHPTLAEYAARFPEILDHGALPDELVRHENWVRETYSAARPFEPGSQDAEEVGSTTRGSSDRTTAARLPSQEQLPVTLGRFQLLELLGEGAFGAVYRAHDAELGRTVAVKTPRAGRRMTDDEQERFLREAKNSALLRHPSIVAVHDAVKVGGIPLLVYDFVEGPTLQQKLSAGPLSNEHAAELAASLAEALEYAHQQHVLHRDVKPGNVLIDPDGRPMLTDFGLARHDRDDSALTVEGQVLGTPAYMPPEQALGRQNEIGPHSDVYSLGAVLYEMLTGQRPFQGEIANVLRQVANDEPAPPRRRIRQIDRDLETICLKAMAKEPHLRYRTAGELAADLRRYLRDDSISARPESVLHRGRRWIRRNPAVSAAGMTLVLAGLFAAAWWFTRPGVLSLQLQPANARVLVGGVVVSNGRTPVRLELRPGVYDVRVEAPGYASEQQEVLVSRGQLRPASFKLQRHTGKVYVECQPPGAELIVDGKSYGSRIPQLAFPTGRRVIEARAVEHFLERKEFSLTLGGDFTERFWLDRGVMWTYSMPWLQGVSLPVGDIDEDRVPDICHMALTELLIFSGATGKIARRHPFPAGFRSWFGVLEGRDAQEDLIAVGQPQNDAQPPFGEAVIFRRSDLRKPLWRKRLFPMRPHTNTHVQLCRLSDLNGDGADEIGAYAAWGDVLILDGKSGDVLRTVVVSDSPRFEVHTMRPLWRGSSKMLLVFGELQMGNVRASDFQTSLVDARRGTVVWQKALPQAVAVGLSVAEDGRADVEWQSATERGWLDGDSGTATATASLLAETAKLPEYRFVLDGKVRRVRGGTGRAAEATTWHDEPTAWRGPVGLNAFQSTKDGRHLWRLSSGELLVRVDESLQAVSPRTGKTRWSFPKPPDSWRVADLEGDGVAEVLLTVGGQGLICLEADGKARWSLRLEVDANIAGMAPDLDGDGRPEIILFKHSGFVTVVRQPRILWKARATGALQATPLVVDVDNDRQPDILQLGPWHNRQTLALMTGRNGAIRQTSAINAPPNRAPVAADLDGDGNAEVISFADSPKHRRLAAHFQSAADLTILGETLMPDGECYSTPVASDFTGDGKRDVGIQMHSGHHVCLFDGPTRSIRWKQKLPAESFGGGAAIDVDDDGTDDLIATCGDGRVYAFRGRDGKRLWDAQVGYSLRGLPAVDRTSRPPRIFIHARSVKPPAKPGGQPPRPAELHVLNARSGESLAVLKTEGATESFGPPVIAATAKQRWLVAALGRAGVGAWDADDLSHRWTLERPQPVMSGVAVADIDGDGKWEVAAATRDGRLLVLDLQTGQRIWDIAVAEQAFEADVVLQDLNADGVQDFLLANHDFSLTAVSGRGVRSARRHLGRPLPNWLRNRRD